MGLSDFHKWVMEGTGGVLAQSNYRIEINEVAAKEMFDRIAALERESRERGRLLEMAITFAENNKAGIAIHPSSKWIEEARAALKGAK